LDGEIEDAEMRKKLMMKMKKKTKLKINGLP